MARVIQEHIKKPLADDILFGKLVRGGHVKVALKDGKLVFDITSAQAPGQAAGGEPALAT
jgi:ATP-dependent Clp protease ATP-binding subunit ClpA